MRATDRYMVYNLGEQGVTSRARSNIPGWPFPDLRAYLAFLEARDHLVRIPDPVDPDLEITAIVQEVVRRTGPALLFERVRGSPYPLVINLFGHPDRILWALGRPPRVIAEEILTVLDRLRRPSGWKAVGTIAHLVWRGWRSLPRRVVRAPVQEVIESPNLLSLPVMRCWPEDGGRFITLGLVITHHPIRGTRNVGIYRLHVYDARTTGMHWQSMKGGRAHYAVAEQRGQSLPVAVVLGGDPVTMLCAVLPLPEEMDELMWAGWIRGRPVPVVRARSIPLDVPASAEFVLEGEVPPGERRLEGPFGDHFGHYSSAHPFPVFHVRTVTRRRRPVYPSTVVGKPPQEDWHMGVAAGELVGPLIQLIYPSVRRIWASPEAGFHHLLIVAVEERHPTEVMKVALGLLGQGQLALTKCLILVPPNVDPTDWEAVLRTIWHRWRPETNLHLITHAPADTLDFTTPRIHVGSKVILDATGPVVRTHPWPEHAPAPSELHPAIVRTAIWPGGHLLIQMPHSAHPRSVLASVLAHPHVEQFLMVWAVDTDVPLDDPILCLWGVFTRFDPARDWVCRHASWQGMQPVYSSPICVDATWKPFYPKPLTLPPAVVQRARERCRMWGLTTSV